MPNRQRCGGNGNNGGTKKKKKKGRAPAHQNSFAYRHNPKSKLTERILSSPNVGTCRRCHDKIEWRKRYRKYRPRTQPGTCNVCRRRNVMAAYHTVCGDCCWITTTVTTTTDGRCGEGTGMHRDCSSSDASTDAAASASASVPADRSAGDGGDDDAGVCDGSRDGGDAPSASDPSDRNTAVATGRKRVRMCAVCTKEPALTSSSVGGDVDDEVDADATSLQGLKLRERRTIERNALREKEELRRRRREGEEGGDTQAGGDGEEEAEYGDEDDEERDLTSEEDVCA